MSEAEKPLWRWMIKQVVGLFAFLVSAAVLLYLFRDAFRNVRFGSFTELVGSLPPQPIGPTVRWVIVGLVAVYFAVMSVAIYSNPHPAIRAIRRRWILGSGAVIAVSIICAYTAIPWLWRGALATLGRVVRAMQSRGVEPDADAVTATLLAFAAFAGRAGLRLFARWLKRWQIDPQELGVDRMSRYWTEASWLFTAVAIASLPVALKLSWPWTIGGGIFAPMVISYYGLPTRATGGLS